MLVLSGTLRFWSQDDPPTEVRLDRVEFAFAGTYEPSLIVEQQFVATIADRRVRFGEYEGVARGLSLSVAGAEHAALVDWVRHGPGASVTRGPDFTDGHVFAVNTTF